MRCLVGLVAIAALAQEPDQAVKLDAVARSMAATFEQDKRFFDDAEVNGYVNSLAARVGGATARVRIIESPEPFRAAIYGGRLYVSTELLAAQQTEADLAAQLAHLAAHLLDPPAFRRTPGGVVLIDSIIDDGGGALPNRDREARADATAAQSLEAAGYQGPNAIVTTSAFLRMRELLPAKPVRKAPSLLR